MAHLAATPEATSSPNPTLRTIVVQGISSVITTKDSRRRLLFTSCVLVIVAATFVTIISLGVYFSNRWNKQFGPVKARDNSFCCPDDAHDAAQYVNVTINPCRNFFARVCSDVIRNGLWKRAERMSELEKIMVTGSLPKGLQKADAAEFLIAYYKSCLKTLQNRHSFLSDVATKLAEDSRDLLRRPNARNAFVYATITSVKYRLPSFLDFDYNPATSQVYVSTKDRCTEDVLSSHMPSNFITLENLFNTSIPMFEVAELHAKICGRFLTLSDAERWYSSLNESDTFDSDVWNYNNLQAAMKTIGFFSSKKIEISVIGGSKIRIMHDVFSSAEYGVKDAVNAAYLLWHSIVSANEQFYSSYDGSWPRVFEICSRSVVTIKEIWDLFTAEILTTPEKDEQAIATFATVKQAVYWDCSRSYLFDGDDAAELESHFKAFTLLTPAASSAMPVALPKPTTNFAENVLRGREFDFQVSRARLWGLHATGVIDAGAITILSGQYFLLSAAFYSAIRPSSTGSQLPNMATLGFVLAKTIWLVALYGIPWNSKTRANIEKLRACFVREYLESDGDLYMTYMTVAAALGMSSLLRAFDRSDWNVGQKAFGAAQMSHGQLFYTVNTYVRCPEKEDPEFVRLVNVPLMYVNDFATTFHCSAESQMSRPGLCPIHAKLGQ